ncbi:MAG: aldo/keto reductase [Bacillota bacterium]
MHNGVDIPAIGLGTFRSKDEDAYNAVLYALKNGYRHIDTAAVYGNEEDVGRAIKDSGVDRKDIFVTTKLWNSDQGYLSTKRALKKSLERLGLDYVDLYLIHWPKDYQKTADSWQALEDLYLDGFTRAIGVSNFTFHHLEHLFETATITPMVNQVETHVKLQNHKLQEFCMKNGIYLEAYAPLMSHHIKDQLLNDEDIAKIAKKHNVSNAQIALAFLAYRDIIIIPKSVTPKRIDENLQSMNVTLDDEDYQALRAMNRGRKFFTEPDNVDY